MKKSKPTKSKAKGVKKVSKSAQKSTQSKVSAASAKIEKSAVGVAPLGDRILVKALSAEEHNTVTAFGIVIPDSSKEKPEQGTVVAVGPGKRGDDNELIPPSVKVGDRVMFSKYGFDEIKVGGVEYLILPESSILAIIE